MSFFVCALCLLLSLAPLLGANKSPIDNSVCKELIHGVPSARQLQLRSILPDKTFWKFVSDHSKPHDDIMFVDVDMNTWSLLVNQVVALKMTGSKLVVFAIAYDDNICKELWSKNVPCYYEKKWIKGLYTAYKKWTGSTLPPGQNLVNVQMGRMITTLVTICEGHNVFLSDGDVVFFRDPMDYVYDNVNIMITATAIGPNPDWGIPYFADNPSTYYALNNGVVFYRNNPVTRSFLMQLTVNCIEFLNRGPDPMWAFLQTRFHVYMRDHHLLFYPSSAVSDPSSFKLVSNYTNKAGECYDCYYGEISIPVNGNLEALRIGAFPMKRFTSLCGEVDRAEYHRIIPIASHALKHNETTHWGWGQLKHGASRVLAIHANCILGIGEAYTLSRFEKKVKWFRSVESWFVD